MSNEIGELYLKVLYKNYLDKPKTLRNKVYSWRESFINILRGEDWLPVKISTLQNIFAVLRSYSLIHRKLQALESKSARTKSKLEMYVKHLEAEKNVLITFINNISKMTECSCEESPAKCIHCLCKSMSYASPNSSDSQ